MIAGRFHTPSQAAPGEATVRAAMAREHMTEEELRSVADKLADIARGARRREC
jgi:hypothetical protein